MNEDKDRKRWSTRSFRRWLERKQYSKNTVNSYARDASLFYTVMSDVRYKSFIEYRDEELAELPPSTANRKIFALNQFMEYLKIRRKKLNCFKIQKNHFMDDNKLLELEDVKKLLKTADEHSPTAAALIRVLAYTGIRVGELMFMTVENAKLGYATIWNKGKFRKILIPRQASEAIQKFAKYKGITKGRVFARTTNAAREILKKTAKLSGVSEKKVFPHNFRHFFAIQFLQNTRDLPALGNILGHSSLNTTAIYTMQTASSVRQKMEAAIAI